MGTLSPADDGSADLRKHGAAKDSWFSHLSISAPKTDGTGKTGTDWLEAVESHEYDKIEVK